MKALIVFSGFLALAAAQTFSFGHCPRVSTMPSFDLNAYMGVWYEIYRFPTTFEKGQKCNTAHYELLPNNHINVTNTGIDPSTNGPVSAHGDAFQASDAAHPAQLKIRFAANTPYGNYWVLKTDYTNYTLIYSCTDLLAGVSHLEFGWILARTRTIPQTQVDELFNIMKSFHIDTSHFVKADQTNC